MSTTSLIYKYKLENLKRRVSNIAAINTAYEDWLNNSLLLSIQDLLDNPESIELSIEPYKKEKGMNSRDFIELQAEMIQISDLCNDLLTEVGNTLNESINSSISYLSNTEKLLDKQTARLVVSENDIISKSDNVSINDEVLFTMESVTEYTGDASVDPIITMPISNISTARIIVESVSVTIPNGLTDAISLKSYDVVEKNDYELFNEGYYIGKMYPTTKYGPSTSTNFDIQNAFDQRMDRYAEYEYVSFSLPDKNDALNVKVTYSVETTGLDIVTIKSHHTASSEVVKVSYDNSTWHVATQRDDIMATDSNYNIKNKQDYYIVNTIGHNKLYVEQTFTQNEYEKLKTPRLNFLAKGYSRVLNYLESVILEANGLYKEAGVSTNYQSVFKQLGFNIAMFYQKAKSSNIFNGQVSNLEITYTDLYRFGITIPEIYVDGGSINSTQSTYISGEFSTDSQILSVELQSEVDFPIATTESTNFKWIEYYISSDKENWTEIRPTTSAIRPYNVSLPTRVVYNNNMPITDTAINIETTSKTSIYVKIVLNRPETLGIPSLENYRLRVKI